MGIRGLKSFVDNNSDLKRRHHLHDTYLVIDGQNLIYSLYWKSTNATNDYLYAGDYNRYAETVRQFFKVFEKCRIKALVVLDGGIDPSQQKINKIIERFRKNLSEAKQIWRGNITNEKMIATLCKPVFLEVISELNVPHIQASFEADNFVAQIANQLKCPVLSNDSDFFVFDLHFGVISIDNIIDSMTVKTYTEPNAPQIIYKFLECNIFLIDNLIQYFPGLKREILPLFSTLMGNDYVDPWVFNKIFNAIPNTMAISGKKSKSLHIGKRHLQMIRLLDWLRGRTLQEAVDFLINFLRKSSRNNALDLLQVSLENYCKGVSPEDKNQTFDLSNLSAFLPNKDPTLPQWFVDEFHKASLSTSLMNVIKMNCDFLSPRVEDFALPSSYSTGLELRQYLFALVRMSDKDINSVKIYDRVGSQLATYLLEPQLATPNSVHILPHLHQIRKLTIDERKLLLKDILSIDDALLELIEAAIGSDLFTTETSGAVFLVVIIRYWISKCKNQIWLEFIYSLITCVIFCGYLGTYAQVKFIRLPDQQVKEFLANAKRFNARPEHNSAKLYQPRIPHYFNEFQDCLKLIRVLNLLFGSPLQMGKPFFALNGVFIYNLTVELSSRKDPSLYLALIFGRQSFATKIFDKLLEIVINGFDEHRFVRCLRVTNRKTHLNSQKIKSLPVHRRANTDTQFNNRFAALNLQK